MLFATLASITIHKIPEHTFIIAKIPENQMALNSQWTGKLGNMSRMVPHHTSH